MLNKCSPLGSRFKIWSNLISIVFWNVPVSTWGIKIFLKCACCFQRTPALSPPSSLEALTTTPLPLTCADSALNHSNYIVGIIFHQVQLMMKICSVFLKDPNKRMTVPSHTSKRSEFKRIGLFPVLCYWESCGVYSEKVHINSCWSSQNSPWNDIAI